MKILAFDSGLERTGFAIMRFGDEIDEDYLLDDFGCIFTDKKKTLQERIVDLHNEVKVLVAKHKPDIFVLEQLLANINKKTVISVAQAQGAVLTIAGQEKLPIEFLSPPQIKQTVTGYGNADKKAVQKMVTLLLELDEVPQPDDTADAIACGYTYIMLNRHTYE